MKKFIIFWIFVSLQLYASAVKIMPFGDSITYDNSYADLENPRPTSMRSAYRNYLWYKLQDAGYNVDFVGSRQAGSSVTPSFDVDNDGYPGLASYELADKAYSLISKSKPDIILLHAGSNDWDDSPSGIEDILDDVDRYEYENDTSVTVILALIINRREYESWIRYFNANVKRMAQRRIDNGDKIVIVDMENGAGINYSSDMRDPAHPTDTGYKKMATVWFNALKTVYTEKQEEALAEQKEAEILEKRVQNSSILPLQFYRSILEREPQEETLSAWAKYLEEGSVISVAMAFFTSEEFQNREANNGVFLNILYRAILGRDADSAGFEYWIDELENNRISRKEILELFLYSPEFSTLVSDYGLILSSPTDTELFDF